MKRCAVALLLMLPVLAHADEMATNAPITADAAYPIAAELYRERAGDCGGVEAPPRDAGDAWAFTAGIGRAGTPDPNPILVDKHTGKASWDHQP